MKTFIKQMLCKHKYKIINKIDCYADWYSDDFSYYDAYTKCEKCWKLKSKLIPYGR